MKRRFWIALIPALLALVMGGYFFYPTIRLLTAGEKLSELERLRLKGRVLPLGIDYIGGIQLVFEADTSGRGFSTEELTAAMENTVIILDSRIKALGVRKADVQRIDDELIQVQLPGIENRYRAVALIGTTGLLEFRLLVGPEATMKIFSDIDAYISGDSVGTARPFSGYLVSVGSDAAVEKLNYRALKKLVDEAHAVVPRDAEILFGPEEEEEGRTIRRVYIVKKKAEITGAEIKDAKAKPYQGSVPNYQGTWVTEIELKRSGQARFADVTGNNVGERLAIVFDDVVKSAPVIKERIPPGSPATITGRDMVGDEMRDLAILIRHGALPVPLKIVEEKTLSAMPGPGRNLAFIIGGMVVLVAGGLFVVVYLSLRKKKQ
jgi:protein-export membrane protein SecD